MRRILSVFLLLIVLVLLVGCTAYKSVARVHGQNRVTTTTVHRSAKQLPKFVEWNGTTYTKTGYHYDVTDLKPKKIGRYKELDLFEDKVFGHSELFIQDAFGDFVLYQNPKELQLKKPNIYLYPENEETLQVDVKLYGRITAAIPTYKHGWEVKVSPTGIIDGKYGFIYYEALIDYPFTLNRGWIVDKVHFSERMDPILQRIGFNNKERHDFIDYWASELSWRTPKYAAYYVSPGEINKAVELKLSKQPDSLLRCYFVFLPVDNDIQIQEPDLPAFVRKGFTVVEWGGIGK